MDAYTGMYYFSRANPGPNFLPVAFGFEVWQTHQVYAVHPKFGVGGRNLATVEGERQRFQDALARFQRHFTRWVAALKEGDSSGSRILASIQEEERYVLRLIPDGSDFVADYPQHPRPTPVPR